ncbi:hypothetical protein GCM10010472_30620 [Pseudonocardia halophobica]|uniref:Uncharacterized protein n=1 Tax=Pseudonocardia halophobica TaxID=29401 RepID=A0A9W6KZA3_9PSEU|nr:hypothetical protein [Pseudonocardia halophobica]GLL09321.1 hypothetical protein GCM10017577_04610 [Pseudonocardia halophobica]
MQDRINDLLLIRDGLQQVIDARCDSLTHCTCQDCPLPFVELSELTRTATGTTAGFVGGSR